MEERDSILDVRAVAVLTKLSYRTIYNYTRQQRIPHIRVGTRVLFDRNRILEWLRSQAVEPTECDAGEPVARAVSHGD